MTGVCYPQSTTKLTDITDGAANTYLVGEKPMLPDLYETIQHPNDDQSMYAGYDWDTIRFADEQHRLMPDHRIPVSSKDPNYQYDTYLQHCYGSAHPACCHFVFCDGSVHGISYDIDPVTHTRLANCADGFPVDKTEFTK